MDELIACFADCFHLAGWIPTHSKVSAPTKFLGTEIEEKIVYNPYDSFSKRSRSRSEMQHNTYIQSYRK